MSIIIQDKGLLTTIQSSNGAVDSLSPQLANKLVGNSVDADTVEMVVRPAIIQFTEPTVIAFSGAFFKALVGDKTIYPNRIYIFDKGDVLQFTDINRGSRIYLAVAGGIRYEKSNILESGDEIIMCRNYTELHDEIFNMMRNNETVSWGIDTYALAEIYLSDDFHIVRRDDTPDEIYEKLIEREYTIVGERNRFAIYLKGEEIEFDPDRIDNYGILGGVFIQDNQPVMAFNDFVTSTSLPHVGTIPSYHMHKLAQKTNGSLLKFKVIDAEDAHVELYKFEMWKKTIFKAIDYKIKKELVKEKM